jgi:hypothetical protein
VARSCPNLQSWSKAGEGTGKHRVSFLNWSRQAYCDDARAQAAKRDILPKPRAKLRHAGVRHVTNTSMAHQAMLSREAAMRDFADIKALGTKPRSVGPRCGDPRFNL